MPDNTIYKILNERYQLILDHAPHVDFVEYLAIFRADIGFLVHKID